MLSFYNFSAGLLPHRDMETTLLPFVFHVYLPCALMVEQHLSQDEFEIILVHVRMRVRYLIITHVREVEGRAVAMTRLRGRVDITASLQVLHIFLRTQHGGYIEAVVR